MAAVSREDKIFMLEHEIHGIETELSVLRTSNKVALAEIEQLEADRDALTRELQREKSGQTSLF